MIDPIILFIASNVLFVAFGALLTTISNELFKTELNSEKEIEFAYKGFDAIFLRKTIQTFVKLAFVFYFLLSIIMVLYFLVPIYSRLITFIMLYFIPHFVLTIIYFLSRYLKIRNEMVK